MLAGEFDWGSGKVVEWKLSNLDEARPLTAQVDELMEDMAGVTYAGGVIDVGWYPEGSPDGSFTVHVVRGSDWESPIMKRRCKSMRALRRLLVEAIACAEKNLARGR